MTPSAESRPARLVVAGAGRVGRATIRELMLRGLRGDAPFSLGVLATATSRDDAAFLVDELSDAAVLSLADVALTTTPDEAFAGCDVAVLTASGPLVGSGSRRELFATNASRVATLAACVLREGREGARVAIVSNPVNALVGHVVRTQRCDPARVSGVVGIDLARARALLARSIGPRAAHAARVAIWGDHSANLAVEIAGVELAHGLVADVDRRLAERGPELLGRHGRTAADSVAVAVREHLAAWTLGSKRGRPTIAAVWHAGAADALGAVPYTMPVRSDGERWLPVRDRLPSDPRIRAAMRAARTEIEQTWDEIDQDRTGVEP